MGVSKNLLDTPTFSTDKVYGVLFIYERRVFIVQELLD